MNNYTIYMHKNKINGKMYIGQTCQNPKYRWKKDGSGYKECPNFWKAIQEEGWNNFEHIILKEKLTLEEANYWEEYYIAYYHTWIDDPQCWGYNMQKGGNNRTLSEEAKEHCKQHSLKLWQSEGYKEKMSQIMKDKWQDPELREKFLKANEKARQEHFEKTGSRDWISEEGKKRISEARKKYIKEHGTATQGKHRSEETKRKISQTRKERGCPTPPHDEHWHEAMKKLRKPIQCIETGVIFSSRTEAAEWANIKSSRISDYLAGRKKSAGRHPETNELLHWREVEIEKGKE